MPHQIPVSGQYIVTETYVAQRSQAEAQTFATTCGSEH